MTGKKALEKMINNYNNTPDYYFIHLYSEEIKTIKQDLEKLEKLKKKNKRLLVNKNVAQGIATKFKEENDRLKKAFDKACELLANYTGSCPVEEELVEDLDCDECDNNCKECWKKYFMKEVLHND